MRMLTQAELAAYRVQDRVLHLMDAEGRPVDEDFISQRWLRGDLAKRLMYDAIYGDLIFEPGPRRRILDVGGGFCSATRRLIKVHDYTLLEINAHDAAEQLRRIEGELEQPFWLEGDWYSQQLSRGWDIVIANDLFPNVDQRLALFLDRVLPLAREVRLSLTFHQEPRFYLARRLDGDEILCMLAYDGERTRRALEPYAAHIRDPDLGLLERSRAAVFANQRQVCIATLKGGDSIAWAMKK